MSDIKQILRRVLGETGFSDTVIQRCEQLTYEPTKWGLRLGVGMASVGIAISVNYLVNRWLQTLEDSQSLWAAVLPVVLPLIIVFALPVLIGRFAAKPDPATQRLQHETAALAYISRMALAARNDVNGANGKMLRNFAATLSTHPEAQQVSLLVDRLGFGDKSYGPMEWYQLGLVLAIITALGLAIWQFAPGGAP